MNNPRVIQGALLSESNGSTPSGGDWTVGISNDIGLHLVDFHQVKGSGNAQRIGSWYFYSSVPTSTNNILTSDIVDNSTSVNNKLINTTQMNNAINSVRRMNHNLYITGVYDDNNKDFELVCNCVNASQQLFQTYEDLANYLLAHDYNSPQHFLPASGLSSDGDTLYGIYVNGNDNFVNVVYNNGGQFGGYYIYKTADEHFNINDNPSEF